MIAAIDKLLEDEMNGKKLSPEEIGQVLGDANFAEHQREAEQRYGSTDDWQTSQDVTASWGEMIGQRIKHRWMPSTTN